MISNMKYLQILWLWAIFLSHQSIVESTKCIDSDKCNCIEAGDLLEWHCPPVLDSLQDVDDTYPFKINLQMKTDKSSFYLYCSKFTEFGLDDLPDIDVGPINYVSIKYCSLPNNRFKDILQHLNITKVKTLVFQMYGPENKTNMLVTKDTLDGLGDVQYLEMSYGTFTLEEDFLESTPNLINLSLTKNYLNNIGYIFNHTPMLEMLDFSRNEIEYLPVGVFENLQNLSKLMLWKNSLTNVSRNTFRGLKNLKLLELSVNPIEHLPEDVFYELPALKILSLRSLNLHTVESNTFKYNPDLENVRLDKNPNLSLADYVFANLTKLQSVTLNESGITTVPEHLFEGSIKLTEVSISRNKIETLPEGIFTGLTELKKLHLSFNKIDVLPETVFSSLEKLEELFLNNNRLQRLNNELLKKLVNLKGLYLSNNAISYVDSRAFADLDNLIRIDLSHNKWDMNVTDALSTLGINPLNGCRSLEDINLEHNLITSFPDELVQTKVKLRRLNLAHNKVEYINVARFVKVSSYEVIVDLSKNNITFIDFQGAQGILAANKDLYTKYDAYHYGGSSTVVLLQDNTIKCDCYYYNLARYHHDMLDPVIKTMVDIRVDGLKCENSSPVQFFKDLKPSNFVCPVMGDKGCPQQCACSWKPYDLSVAVDCSYRNLTMVPPIKLNLPANFIYNQTMVDLKHNMLETGPSAELDGYNNVTYLDLSENYLSNLTWIPPHIQVLRLQSNNIKSVSDQMIKELKNRTSLHQLSLYGNPWKCDCSASHLQSYLRLYYKKVHTADVKCHGTGELLVDIKELCKVSLLITAALPVLLSVFLFITIALALYYRYQNEIKIYLYAKNLCLWFVTEEELDKDKIYDIFLSYSHKDEDFVTQNLLPVLEGAPKPFKICIHVRDWAPGEFISTQIANSVLNSRRTLVVLSNNFMESVWGKMEFRTAHTQAISEGRARVVVVVYGDLNENALDDELKTYLKTNTYVKWGDPWFWNKLKYALPHRKHAAQKSNKHANIMLKLDDKFELVNSTPSPNNNSTPPLANLDPGSLKNHPLNFKPSNMTPPAETPLMV